MDLWDFRVWVGYDSDNVFRGVDFCSGRKNRIDLISRRIRGGGGR
jgi:hypothetical protein